ncbi:KEOPS complex subunit Pcc1 [Halalkalicoccus ordinarius]|uniref:KEOPS complex subunit Pcc1 n=1 Tax=Halalkalicoccus ordinarius TaxID=3116651 RepID=UPI00300EE28F
MSRRRAEIRTSHDDPEVVARALRPDNTPEMDTRVRDEQVVTTIERETTGGLRTTVDDYVVNLTVASEVQRANQPHETQS